MKPIILASQSPRRKQLLSQAEIEFVIETAHADEVFPADLPIEEVPTYIAANKALAVAAHHPEALIIAADTVVVLDDEIIGKPSSEVEAIQILTRLSGRTHRVITGCYLCGEGKSVTITETTRVTFRPITESQIKHYVAHYKPFDKAGAYAIQEWIGLIGIEKIEGDFYNVMGLPISKVMEAIQNF
jgi:septum formation protein